MRLLVVIIWLAMVAPGWSQTLSERIAAITDRSDYKHGRWGILVVDAADGAVVFERNPDQLFVPASTTKLYSCAAALAELGGDYRFKTRVVASNAPANGILDGSIVLIASGDPTMGGRTKVDGTMAFVNGDHTYADATSTTAGVTDTDPLAGLTALARQVKKAGVDEIRGDVLIDDRLFDTARSSGSGPDVVTPIVVNDNVIDFVIRAKDNKADVRTRPEAKFVQVDSRITVAGDKPRVTVTTVGPWRYTLRGTIPANNATHVRIIPVQDPAAFARSLFTECLEREGVVVAASSLATNQALPMSLRTSDHELALYSSPPLSELIKVTLKVSHNLYASTLPSLIAAKAGNRTAAEGLAIEGKFLRELGVETNAVAFAGGAGGAPADSTTPRATVSLLQKLRGQPKFAAIVDGLPILGVDGTLATVVKSDSPAKGQVRGKTGTLFWMDHVNGRLLLRSKAIAGVMTAKNGKTLIFAMFVNDVPLPPGVTPAREGAVLGQLCEIIYDAAP